MINFRVDGRSVMPPYLQIVQQVRRALRMGLLDVGDKLPAVREVVAATAVNPNTVDDDSMESLLRITLCPAAEEEIA